MIKKKKSRRTYPEDTAGSRMIDDVPMVEEDITIGEVLSEIEEKIKRFETINYVYVIDEEKRLIGVFSIKEAFKANKMKKVKDIMEKNLINTDTLTDQEKVVYLALKHNLKAIPVVDSSERLLGIVPSDTLLEILYKEAGEDILHMGAVSSVKNDRLLHGSISTATRFRLPWLIITLLGGLAAGGVIAIFEEALDAVLALALFIPVIMHIGGSVGSQSSTIVIRGLATGSVALNHVRSVVWRELRIGISLGLICGIFAGIAGYLWQGDPGLGITVGVSMITTLVVAATVGGLLPIIFQRFGVDPAVASGPLITTIKDITGLFIYFSMATLIMGL
ncbi:MAG: magnesium transporter [Methanobacteriaceae archaeon]|jgi:magnesium transporter